MNGSSIVLIDSFPRSVESAVNMYLTGMDDVKSMFPPKPSAPPKVVASQSNELVLSCGNKCAIFPALGS